MKSIVIADDEIDVRRWLAGELEARGYRAQPVGDGVHAILQVMEGGVHAVLMDVRMPKLNGIDALRILRRLYPEVPVILCTGHAGRGDMFEADRLGAASCLLKPLQIGPLVAILERVTPGSEAAHA